MTTSAIGYPIGSDRVYPTRPRIPRPSPSHPLYIQDQFSYLTVGGRIRDWTWLR